MIPVKDEKSGNRWYREWSDGSRSWGWVHPTLYWDLIVEYRAHTATGCGWLVSASYMSNPRDGRSRVEIKGFGVTRREAFVDFRIRLGALRILVNQINSRVTG